MKNVTLTLTQDIHIRRRDGTEIGLCSSLSYNAAASAFELHIAKTLESEPERFTSPILVFEGERQLFAITFDHDHVIPTVAFAGPQFVGVPISEVETLHGRRHGFVSELHVLRGSAVSYEYGVDAARIPKPRVDEL